MTTSATAKTILPISAGWLKSYYFTRFAVSAIWVVAAVSVAKDMPAVAAILLVGYPAWDALANVIDARHSGGLGRNAPQTLNVVVGILTTLAVAVALGRSMNAVLLVFGIWAGLAGVFQLATAIRRWRGSGAQWPMILSGAQSALAGVFMVVRAHGPDPVGIVGVAPYAAFGAFYFLLSALWLTVSEAPRLRWLHLRAARHAHHPHAGGPAHDAPWGRADGAGAIRPSGGDGGDAHHAAATSPASRPSARSPTTPCASST